MSQTVIFTNDVADALNRLVVQGGYHSVAVLTDEHTRQLVLPLLSPCEALRRATHITIAAGESHKTLESLTQVWTALQQSGATRQSLLVNLGGGLVTDLGGLAASTFKRGIPFVNVPTTVLGAVDAAVGGKTGIDFGGLKNEIGTFCPANAVIVSACFFDTLPREEVMAGYAEMVKHAMLQSVDELNRVLDTDFGHCTPEHMLELVEASVQVKRRIVAEDPTEQGLRRALNLGHTVGHAIESFALERGKPVRHGYAVAWGLVVESVLSHLRQGFPSEVLYRLARFVRENYGAFHITCDDYDLLLQLMRHDKKSRHGEINCTLLRQCGDVALDVTVSDDDMKAAIDIYRDLMGI